MTTIDRTVRLWLVVGWIGYAILPWYGIDGFWSFEWLFDDYPLDEDSEPAILQALLNGKWWIAPIIPPLLAPLALIGRRRSEPAFANILTAIGLAGLGAVLLQGFAIGLRGWQFAALESLFGPLDDRQFGIGVALSPSPAVTCGIGMLRKPRPVPSLSSIRSGSWLLRPMRRPVHT